MTGNKRKGVLEIKHIKSYGLYTYKKIIILVVQPYIDKFVSRFFTDYSLSKIKNIISPEKEEPLYKTLLRDPDIDKLPALHSFAIKLRDGFSITETDLISGYKEYTRNLARIYYKLSNLFQKLNQNKRHLEMIKKLRNPFVLAMVGIGIGNV